MILKSLLKWSIPSIIISPIFCVISCNKNNNDNLKQIKNKFENYLNQNQTFVTKKGLNSNIKNFQLYKDWKNVDDLLSTNYLSKYFDINEGFKNLLEQNNNEIFKKIKAFVIQPVVNSKNLKIIFYLDKITNDSGVVNFEISNFFESDFEYQNLINLTNNSSSNNYYESVNKFNEVWKELSKNPEDVNIEVLKEMLIKGFAFDNDQIVELNKIINKYKEGYFKLTKSGYQIILSLEQKAIDEGYIFVQEFNNNLPKYNVEWTSSQLAKEN